MFWKVQSQKLASQVVKTGDSQSNLGGELLNCNFDKKVKI